MAGLLTPPTTPYKSQKQKRRAPLTTADLNLPRLGHDVPLSFGKPKQPLFNKQREPSPVKWETAWLGEPALLVPNPESCARAPFGESVFPRETRQARPLTPPPEPEARPTAQRESVAPTSKAAGDDAKYLTSDACGHLQSAVKPERAKLPPVENPKKGLAVAQGARAKKPKALSWRATQELIFLDEATISAPRTIQGRIFRDEPQAKVSSKAAAAAAAPVPKKKEPLFLPWDSEDERSQHNRFWEQYEPLWPSDDDSEDDAALRLSMQNEPMVLDIAHERPADPRPKREPQKSTPPKYVPKPFSTCGVEVGMRAADKNVDSPLESMNTAEETRGSQALARRQVQPHFKAGADVAMKEAGPSSTSKLKRGAVHDAESDGRGTKRRRVEIQPATPTQARHTHRKFDLTRTATSKTASKATKKAPAAARNVRTSQGSDYSNDEMKGGPARHPWLGLARKIGIISPFY